MAIVNRFTLGAVNWSTVIDNDRLLDLGFLGLTEYVKALITLTDEKVSDSIVEETFYHELVHAILHSLGRKDLNEDESFVQSFAILLYQFEKTKNYG